MSSRFHLFKKMLYVDIFNPHGPCCNGTAIDMEIFDSSTPTIPRNARSLTPENKGTTFPHSQGAKRESTKIASGSIDTCKVHIFPDLTFTWKLWACLAI